MTAIMMTAARAGLGMNSNNGVRNKRDNMIMPPVTTPPIGVRTPH